MITFALNLLDEHRKWIMNFAYICSLYPVKESLVRSITRGSILVPSCIVILLKDGTTVCVDSCPTIAARSVSS